MVHFYCVVSLQMPSVHAPRQIHKPTNRPTDNRTYVLGHSEADLLLHHSYPYLILINKVCAALQWSFEPAVVVTGGQVTENIRK